MDSETLMLVGIGVAVLLLGLAVWAYMSRRRHANLRERFGPEYDRTVEAVGPARADAVLRERTERVSRFDLRKLTRDQADAFVREWRRVQGRFVDDPGLAVGEADQLVTQVMTARGYPLEDFDRRADDLSVKRLYRHAPRNTHQHPGSLRCRGRAGPRLPPGDNRCGNRLHGGHRRGTVPGSRPCRCFRIGGLRA